MGECIILVEDDDSREEVEVLSFEDGDDDEDVSVIESLEANSVLRVKRK